MLTVTEAARVLRIGRTLAYKLALTSWRPAKACQWCGWAVACACHARVSAR